MAELSKFLKELPCASVAPSAHGSIYLDEQIIKEIQNEVSKVQEQNRRKKKIVKMQVRPHLLYQVRR